MTILDIFFEDVSKKEAEIILTGANVEKFYLICDARFIDFDGSFVGPIGLADHPAIEKGLNAASTGVLIFFLETTAFLAFFDNVSFNNIVETVLDYFDKNGGNKTLMLNNAPEVI